MSARGLNVFVSIGAKLLPSINRSAGAVEKRFGLMSRRLRVYAAETKASYRAMSAAASPLLGLAAAGGLASGLTKIIGAGSEYEHQLTMLRASGRTVKEIAAGVAQANRTVAALPTSTLTDNLKVLNETTLAYGNFGHALENLTFNQRMGGMLTNILGDKVGDPGEMFNNLVRAFEIRGSALDRRRYQSEASKLFQAMIATHGTVNPEEFLGFAQQANPALKSYNERYLTRIVPSLIQEFGGERAGTMSTAWTNQILGRVGVGGKKLTDEWIRLGLVPKAGTGGNFSRTGWSAGSLKDTNLALSDPLAWTEKVLVPALQEHGVDTNDSKAMMLAVKKLFGRETAARLATTLTDPLQRKRLHKDEALFSKAMGPDRAYALAMRQDPKMALAATAASLKNLETVLGRAITPETIAGLTNLARAINWIAGVFDRHPNFAKGVVGLVGLGALAATFRVLGIGLRFLAAPLGLVVRMLEPLVALGPIVLNVLTRLAPFVIRGLIMAFGLLSNPVGWAIILAGVAAALIYYFRDDLARAWPKVVAWFKGAWNGLKSWLLSINWSSIGMTIANGLTFGLAGKFASAWAKIKATVAGGIPSPAAAVGKVGMNSPRGGLSGARARGGSVRRGSTYLVGEEGPELFTAGSTGNIIPFRRTAAMMGAAAAAMTPMAAAAQPAVSVTINVNGAQDPHAIALEVDRQLRRTLRQVGADNGRFLND